MLSYIFYFVTRRVKDKQSEEISRLMSRPVVFGVYGNSNTGKTTLMVHLISRLTREGYRVATIKQTRKEITMDRENKDTWRHHDAGADLVVFSSQCETDFLLGKAISVAEIIHLILRFGDFDLVLLEGANDPAIPKIQVGQGKKRSNTVVSFKGDFEEVLTLITSKLRRKSTPSHLSIAVNGKDIALSEFPEQIITNTLIAMVESLKAVEEINQLLIQLKR